MASRTRPGKGSSSHSATDGEASLTEPQSKVLAFIRERCRETGLPPSYREIQAFMGYKAVGSVQDHVKALMRKGLLEHMKDKGGTRQARGLLPRGMRVEGAKQIPIYGEIAAGPLRDTPQVELGSLVVSDAVAKDPCFALRVVGDSMIEAGIHEGDYLVVERTDRASHGDIVVALVNGETTVKRYAVLRDGVYLVPENRRLKPIRVTGEQFSIQGRVVGLQRKF